MKGIKKIKETEKAICPYHLPMHLQMQPPNHASDSPGLGGKMPTALGRGNEESGHYHGVPRPGHQAVHMP